MCPFAEINKAINGWPIKRRLVHIPIRQRLHEDNERVLVGVSQPEASDFARVHVIGRLRRGPACRALAGVMGLASRQDVARVVEMHDLLQAREISVYAHRP